MHRTSRRGATLGCAYLAIAVLGGCTPYYGWHYEDGPPQDIVIHSWEITDAKMELVHEPTQEEPFLAVKASGRIIEKGEATIQKQATKVHVYEKYDPMMDFLGEPLGCALYGIGPILDALFCRIPGKPLTLPDWKNNNWDTHKPKHWYLRNWVNWLGWIFPGIQVGCDLPLVNRIEKREPLSGKTERSAFSRQKGEPGYLINASVIFTPQSGRQDTLPTDKDGVARLEVGSLYDAMLANPDFQITARLDKVADAVPAEVVWKAKDSPLIIALQKIENANRIQMAQQEQERRQYEEALADARSSFEMAEGAWARISEEKARIHAPEELRTGRRALEKSKQYFATGNIGTIETAREAARLARESLALAQQADRNIAMAYAAVASPPPPRPAIADSLPKRRNIALVIGIDRYEDNKIAQLGNPVGDARAVGQTLRQYYGFEIVELFDEKATRVNILETIRGLVQSLQEGDNFLIYYAGHGEMDEVLKVGYWIPYEARLGIVGTYVSNSDIYDGISAMGKAQHVFLVSDSCFSGSFFDVRRGSRSISVGVEEATNNAQPDYYYTKMDRRKSRIAFTSGAKENVTDYGHDGHSVFCYYFLQALVNPDEPVFTSVKLIDRVSERVANNAKQTPLSGELKNAGHDQGQMEFIRKSQ